MTTKKDRNFLEKDLQALFTKWVENTDLEGAPYELKITRGKTLAFSKFEPQQLPSLHKANTGVKHHKMTDASLGMKPYDGYWHRKSQAYVGVMFEANWDKYDCYLIPIGVIWCMRNLGFKSIKEIECAAIGIEVKLK